MPIPPLKKKKNQSWRNQQNQKKKYYISRSKNLNYNRGKQNGKSFDFKNIFSDSFKKKAFFAIGGFLLLSILSGVIFVVQLSKNLPDPNRLLEREIAQSTKIYDRTGEELLYDIHGNEQRTIVNMDNIPNYLKWATIAVEDKDFYKHKGVSLWAIFRTLITNVLYGQRAGGSTLTQQFIKNSVLTSEKKYTRKIKEALLAYRLEKSFSKDEILQMYFNEIPYGSTAYGVEAASRRYFGKGVGDINLAESAILAALPQGPSRYSPYGSNKDLLIERQIKILNLMVEQGYIKQEEALDAKEFALEFKPPAANIKAPHFVMYIKEILSAKYGEKQVEQGGLKIITTLDLYKQKIAEEVISELAEKNEKNYDATNASLVSIDPKTGQVLAMVGSRDYFNEKIDGQVNISTCQRQPGSSLKPLVFAACFLKGYTPETILYDVVTDFSNINGKPYEPHNYDSKEHGPVNMRKALAGSLNIPAVKIIYLAGVKNVSELAGDLGYTTLSNHERYGLSLVLGGAEVKLLEHVNAYGAFAREGILHPIATILRIEDSNGKTLEEFEKKEKKVLDPKIARQINNILSDNNARAYAFGEKNWLTLGSRPVAAKTGTTNDYRDAWTVGYTPSIVTGVWVGNNDNSEMKRGAAGGTVAAPIWHDYMNKILGDTPIETFREPKIVKTGKAVIDGEITPETIIKIDEISGLLATEHTPEHLIKEKAFFQPHSILYYINKNDPLGEKPENPSADPQFELWENRILEWAKKQKATSTEPVTDELPPTEEDNIHLPENLPKVEIISPSNNQTILEPMLFSRINATAPRGINRAEYYINNNLLHIANSYPFNLAKQISFLNNGFHNLKIKVCDDVDNCVSEEVEFNLILENNANKPADFTLKLSSPASGLALSNIDFPLSLKAEINNPEYISTIIFYYIDEDKNENKITTITDLKDTNEYLWAEAPASGTYKIFARANTWTNKIIKSEVVVVTVNNVDLEKIE
ncbi:penicillin-binding protein [Candidatus Parcubacteria bacterium]|nr:penicillin-binding protein [Candidatus Parcubacteria bacterium]